MKRICSYTLLSALTALTFTACEHMPDDEDLRQEFGLIGCKVSAGSDSKGIVVCSDGSRFDAASDHNGSSCSFSAGSDGSGTMACSGSKNYSLSNGFENIPGTECKVSLYRDNNNREHVEIECHHNGYHCNSIEAKSGPIAVTCGDAENTKYSFNDGKNGLSGHCQLFANGDTTGKILCSDGAIFAMNGGYDGQCSGGYSGASCNECALKEGASGTLKDSEGKEYKTVVINCQTWMAENLATATGRDGSELKCYKKNKKYKEQYGCLYTWSDARKACPTGWHLPAKKDFDDLLAAAGTNAADRSQNLRAASFDGNDKLKFAALPGGYHTYIFDKYEHVDDIGLFWSGTEQINGITDAYALSVHPAYVEHGDPDVHMPEEAVVVSFDRPDGISVRCIKD